MFRQSMAYNHQQSNYEIDPQYIYIKKGLKDSIHPIAISLYIVVEREMSVSL